ncbi:MAG: Ohr family peroxiredoxin [Pseudomonadota bacterium]
MTMSQLSAPPVSLLDLYAGEDVLPLYKTSVLVSGGEVGHGRASGRAVSDDGALDVPLRLPVALGGPGGATNPEQLFAAGFAACFHGALSLVATKRKIRLDRDCSVGAEVTFGRDPSDGLILLSAQIQVHLPNMAQGEALDLVRETEAICPYAKMSRQGIEHSTRLV